MRRSVLENCHASTLQTARNVNWKFVCSVNDARLITAWHNRYWYVLGHNCLAYPFYCSFPLHEGIMYRDSGSWWLVAVVSDHGQVCETEFDSHAQRRLFRWHPHTNISALQVPERASVKMAIRSQMDGQHALHSTADFPIAVSKHKHTAEQAILTRWPHSCCLRTDTISIWANIYETTNMD